MSANLSIELASHNKCSQHKKLQFYMSKNYVTYSMVISKKTLFDLTRRLKQCHFVISFESRTLLRLLPRIRGFNKRSFTNTRIIGLIYDATHVTESNETLSNN